MSRHMVSPGVKSCHFLEKFHLYVTCVEFIHSLFWRCETDNPIVMMCSIESDRSNEYRSRKYLRILIVFILLHYADEASDVRVYVQLCKTKLTLKRTVILTNQTSLDIYIIFH